MLIAHPPTIVDFKKVEKKASKKDANKTANQPELLNGDVDVGSVNIDSQELIDYSTTATIESTSSNHTKLQTQQPSLKKDYTKITFEPDLQRFGFIPYSNSSRYHKTKHPLIRNSSRDNNPLTNPLTPYS